MHTETNKKMTSSARMSHLNTKAFNAAGLHGERGTKWESTKVSHQRVFALLTPEKPHQKPVLALPDCQPISVNTLLCGTLGLAEYSS